MFRIRVKYPRSEASSQIKKSLIYSQKSHVIIKYSIPFITFIILNTRFMHDDRCTKDPDSRILTGTKDLAIQIATLP